MSDTNLKNRLQEDMKAALKAREQKRLGAIRLILAAIKQREIDQQILLDDAGVISLLDKLIKQRRDAMGQFQAANRHDLADQEAYEIQVIETYLPAKLSEMELDEIIRGAIHETQAQSVADMGKVMWLVKPQVEGRADMRQISETIKQRLAARN